LITINSYNSYQPNFTACNIRRIKPEKIRKTVAVENKNSDKFDKIKENLKNYIKGYPKRIRYTAKHKKAFLKMEKELTGKNTLSGYLHDMDKLIMYIIGVPKQLAHDIHVATASHHVRNGHIKKPIQAVIDWECARCTKPDKPLNARDFYENYYVKKQKIRIPEIEEILQKFGL